MSKSMMDILLQNDLPAPQMEEYKIKRLSKLWGVDVVFKLRELSFSRVAEIRKAGETPDGDMTSLQTLLAGVVEPDLKDAALLEKYRVPTATELLKKLLLPGEIEDLSRAVERLSGFRTATIEAIKKN